MAFFLEFQHPVWVLQSVAFRRAKVQMPASFDVWALPKFLHMTKVPCDGAFSDHFYKNLQQFSSNGNIASRAKWPATPPLSRYTARC